MAGNTIPGLPPNPTDPDAVNPTSASSPASPLSSAGAVGDEFDPYPAFSGSSTDAPSRTASGNDVTWKLETIEPRTAKFQNFTVIGQFPLDDGGLSITIGQNIPEGGAFGAPHPIIQWVRGNLQVVTFNVILFSRDAKEDVKFTFDNLVKMQERDSSLGRPPLCRFTLGTILSIKCMIRGLGDVKISRPKPDGSARKYEFSLTLARYEPCELKEVGGKPKESRMQTVSGDLKMHEWVARREFGIGSTLHGDRLRKRSKEYPFYVPDGETTKVPSATIILREKVQPEFHAFDENDSLTYQLILGKFITRNTRVLIV